MKTAKLDSYEMTDDRKAADTAAGDVIIFPASFAQRRFWFLDRLMPDGWAFNLPAAYRIKGSLNVAALEKTFSEIVRRHEILRTTFREVEGVASQIIADPQPVRLPVVDLRMLEPASRGERIQGCIDAAFGSPFNLASGPLMTITLLRTGDDEHVVIKNMHHIITDSWSEEVFLREWVALYDSFSQNKPATLAPLPIQYADFSEWQKQSLQGETMEREVAYWMKQLGGGIPPLSLPTDHPRPANASLAGAAVKFTISPQTASQLRNLARQEGVTLFITLLTAFKVLLYRYTGHADMAVGTPITNRNRAELENLIGFFLNTLVLRTDLGGAPGFREALGRVRETTLGAFEHQDLPFEVVVEKLHPARDLAQHPFSQAMFVMLPVAKHSWETGGLAIEAMEVGRHAVEQDLVLSLHDKGDAIEGLFTYSTALFEKATIASMTRHFETLLESVAANPERSIDELDLLDAAERNQILVEWNSTAAPCTMVPVHEQFAAQCARAPGAIAIEFNGRAISYAGLLDGAQRLAAHLQQLGVGPGQLVGICVERSPEMITGVLGILMSGAAYVPLDPEFPAVRLRDMLEDARPPVIVTQRSVESSLPKSDSSIVYIEDERAPAADFQLAKVTAEGLAYVLFTSGSTGRPKGVEIPHRALTNLLESMRGCPGLLQTDTLLAVTTLSFDIAGLELFLPLISGAKVLLADRAASHDPRRLAEILARPEVTVMQATPATWRGLLAAGWKGSPKLKVLCGGEAMPRDLARALLPRCSSLWNVYGPTETTIWSTVAKVAPGTDTVSIGRPIANTRIYILDKLGQPQPAGVYGELCIGGLGVARGYLNREGLTAEKFVADPHGQPGDRYYRTGDLARYLADGSIDFLGRIDHQVKVRGFRIELAEIESALGGHPSVAQCVVIARDDPSGGDKWLVAYVVRGGDVSEANLRIHVKNKLPDYMLPSVYMFLEALPLTPNGKIDRNALPDPGQSKEQERAFVGPSTPLEEKLAGIWARVLKLPQVGIHDDFFELGGHSLMAVTLFTEIERKIGRNLPLATLFQAPTIAQLAAVIEQEGWSAPWSPLVPIQPHGRREPFFCIHGGDGGVLFYSKLAALLGEEQPFYGLQSQGQDGSLIRHSSMESIAALYIKDIRCVQPSGPYFLGGYSFGGILAMEIAQQLRADGETIAMLALFDANNPTVPPRRYTLRERIVLRSRVIAGRSLWGKLSYISHRAVGKLAVKIMVARERVNRAAYRLFSKNRKTVAQHYRMMRVHEAHGHALQEYRPSVYQGKLTLIRAENPNDSFEFDSELGWGGLAADGIEIHDVPGEHETIFHEPHVRILAAIMKDCIEKARNAQAFK